MCDRVGGPAIVGAACADAVASWSACSSLIRYGMLDSKAAGSNDIPSFSRPVVAGNGSVQRMGDHAALANRSFWLACG